MEADRWGNAWIIHGRVKSFDDISLCWATFSLNKLLKLSEKENLLLSSLMNESEK